MYALLHTSFPVLISQRIDTDVVKTVNSRHLHSFLEAGKDFSNWMKDRIEQDGFSETRIMWLSPKLAKTQRAVARPNISLDMAKELSKVEGNVKGNQARQYFIECER